MGELRGLRDKRRRLAAGRFLVEGFHCVEEALASGAPVEELFIGEGAARSPAGSRIAGRARERGLPVTEVPRRVLDALAAAETPQGVVALVRMAEEEWEEVLDRDGVAVVLDGIQDPGNAGALVRAADAFGCASVIFARGSVEPVNPKVLRAAQGSHFHLPVVPGPDAAEVAAAARARGHQVFATAASGGEDLFARARPSPRTAVLFGNEARGVSPGAMERCEGRITVPLRGRAESLGVAAAGAVVLAWFARGAAAD